LPKYSGDHFIAVSNATRKLVIEDDDKLRNRITTVNYGIDLESNDGIINTRIREKLGIPESAVIVSIIGRIIKHKGHEILLKAIESLKVDLNIICLIVGNGDLFQEIKTLSSNLSFRIIFTGLIENPKDYFSVSDIHIVPSLCCEGLPITLLEAGKHSKPVIASNIDGISNILQHKVNGMLVRPGNQEDISSAIRLLIDSKEMRKSLGGNLRKTIQELYSSKRMVTEMIDIYKMVQDR